MGPSQFDVTRMQFMMISSYELSAITKNHVVRLLPIAQRGVLSLILLTLIILMHLRQIDLTRGGVAEIKRHGAPLA